MRRIEASRRNASALRLRFSQSFSLVYGWLFDGDSGLPALIAAMGFLVFAFIFELVQRHFDDRDFD